MKKIILAVLFLVSFVVVAHAADGFVIPNLEASVVYSAVNRICLPALTSKFLQYKILEVRVGYETKDGKDIGIGGLSVNLKNLPASVEYCWQDILNISVGTYAGWDSDMQKMDWGLSATIIKINFGK